MTGSPNDVATHTWVERTGGLLTGRRASRPAPPACERARDHQRRRPGVHARSDRQLFRIPRTQGMMAGPPRGAPPARKSALAPCVFAPDDLYTLLPDCLGTFAR